VFILGAFLHYQWRQRDSAIDLWGSQAARVGPEVTPDSVNGHIPGSMLFLN
jgi:hypothetical protein